MFDQFCQKQKRALKQYGRSSTLMFKVDSVPLESMGYCRALQTLSVLLNPRPLKGTSLDGTNYWGSRVGKRCLYTYHGVPEILALEIYKSDFPGETFQRLIVQGKYHYDRIEFDYDFLSAAQEEMFQVSKEEALHANGMDRPLKGL